MLIPEYLAAPSMATEAFPLRTLPLHPFFPLLLLPLFLPAAHSCPRSQASREGWRLTSGWSIQPWRQGEGIPPPWIPNNGHGPSLVHFIQGPWSPESSAHTLGLRKQRRVCCMVSLDPAQRTQRSHTHPDIWGPKSPCDGSVSIQWCCHRVKAKRELAWL